MYYVYILKSQTNHKSYVGFSTKKPDIRLSEHNQHCNFFTTNNGPWDLVYYEQFTCELCARARETFLKSGIGNKLVRLIITNAHLFNSSAVSTKGRSPSG
ncbi:MAG TPA: hypothetical protein ENN77_01000, partial [Candidatus Wirthbacteria bacterium]|nr:hypothetical protein [Candidatus Wirthbacteria bacterium]